MGAYGHRVYVSPTLCSVNVPNYKNHFHRVVNNVKMLNSLQANFLLCLRNKRDMLCNSLSQNVTVESCYQVVCGCSLP